MEVFYRHRAAILGHSVGDGSGQVSRSYEYIHSEVMDTVTMYVCMTLSLCIYVCMYVCIMPFIIFECRCWSSDSYNPVPGVIANPNLPSNNEYKGGFGSGSASKIFIHIPYTYIRTYIHTYAR